MADATLPGIRAGTLGNHRHRAASKRAAVELIPSCQRDCWHVAIFRDGLLRYNWTPRPIHVIAKLLDGIGFDATDVGGWRSRWCWPVEDNPYRQIAQQGCVYYVQAGPGGLIKIGTTINLGRRFVELQRASPAMLELVFACTGGEWLESDLHRRFRRHHHHGEWFEPAKDVLAFAEQMCDARELYKLLAIPWTEPLGDPPDAEPELPEHPLGLATGSVLVASRRRPHRRSLTVLP